MEFSSNPMLPHPLPVRSTCCTRLSGTASNRRFSVSPVGTHTMIIIGARWSANSVFKSSTRSCKVWLSWTSPESNCISYVVVWPSVQEAVALKSRSSGFPSAGTSLPPVSMEGSVPSVASAVRKRKLPLMCEPSVRWMSIVASSSRLLGGGLAMLLTLLQSSLFVSR